MLEYIYIMGIKITLKSLDKLLEIIKNTITDSSQKQQYIVTVNPEILLQAQKDFEYKKFINNSLFNIDDGVGLQIAAFVFAHKIPYRITGVDLSKKIIELAQKNKWKIFLLGTQDINTLKQARKNLQNKFPGLQIVGIDTGPQFKDVQDLKNNPILNKKNNLLLTKINKSKAQIIFVAFGAPKQEKWIDQFLSELPNIKLAIGVGGTLDYFAGKNKRAPLWMRKIGLEWFYRLIRQPFRLKRIFKATCLFMTHVVYWKIRMIFLYRPNVLAVIIRKNKVLLIQTNSEVQTWKFPQGGIEAKEISEDGLFREIKEELGIPKEYFEILYSQPKFYKYNWRETYIGKYPYKGQKQDLFILKLKTDANDILKKHIPNEEVLDYKWVDIDNVINEVSEERKFVTTKVYNIIKNLKLKYE